PAHPLPRDLTTPGRRRDSARNVGVRDSVLAETLQELVVRLQELRAGHGVPVGGGEFLFEERTEQGRISTPGLRLGADRVRGRSRLHSPFVEPDGTLDNPGEGRLLDLDIPRKAVLDSRVGPAVVLFGELLPVELVRVRPRNREEAAPRTAVVLQ